MAIPSRPHLTPLSLIVSDMVGMGPPEEDNGQEGHCYPAG
jgi:hypothetical protein